jgi:outer membrane protein assembly factor BamB
MRPLFITVAALALALVAMVVVLSNRSAKSGQVYAFDVDSGAEVWHQTFPGVDPTLLIDGATVTVLATVGSGCDPGENVFSRFDARTGRPVSAPVRTHDIQPHPETEIEVIGGGVTVRGHRWKAHVLSREPSKAVAAGHLVFVAVTGLWGKLCND